MAKGVHFFVRVNEEEDDDDDDDDEEPRSRSLSARSCCLCWEIRRCRWAYGILLLFLREKYPSPNEVLLVDEESVVVAACVTVGKIVDAKNCCSTKCRRVLTVGKIDNSM